VPNIKHLVFDTEVIADLWMGKGAAAATALIFERAVAGRARIWISASSIPALDLRVERALKRSGVSRAESRQRIAGLMEALLGVAGVLTNYGFEQKELYRGARCAAQAQISAAARTLKGVPLCVVAESHTFDAPNDLMVMTPDEALSWVRDERAGPHAHRRMPFIDLSTPLAAIRPDVEQGIARVLHHGQYIMGPEIAELEAKLAGFVGVKHALTTASGTDSLEIALRALGIGFGDEVVTVPFTWISTAEVIAQVGARPVFVDIDPVTYNMNADLLASAITPKTRAIMPVSLFGQVPDLERINAIADRFGIAVIEDAAQSFGATRHGRRSCGLTRVASTSFFPAKPFGCFGDGGALFTEDDLLADTMRAIRTHGGQKRHHHPFVGMNGRMDTLQAAILLAKLPVFEEEIEARRRIGARYTDALRGVCQVPEVNPGNTHVYAQYTIRAANRDAFMSQLDCRGVPTAVYYPKCLHEQPAFAGCGYVWGDFPEAERASREVVSLPMHAYLSQMDQDQIIDCIKSSLLDEVNQSPIG
jgi:UDP-2-acetamido-2-deoxy-ribo-hexuluronate aminotransferase